MSHANNAEIASARHWLERTCHHAGVRRTLELGLDCVEALERAGIPSHVTSGDELYEFLSDSDASQARNHAFAPPSL